ncbi:uncharacterized protein LOC128184580 [Crassostrea angulata]|uniref:uncharacterized protein LOC128184580 n=1 Tax=Magallana angulata TaxID=2784310 RepID=UPI0022B08702|nr:uncharacterized protein LOC128184580 [Crassostrea angulata]
MLWARFFFLLSIVQVLGAEFIDCPSLVREVPNLCEDLRYSRHCHESCRNHRLTCHNCHDIHHPGSCTKTTTCQAQETCVITTALDHTFRLTYRQGCFPKQNCSLFIHDNISTRRNTLLPGDCCYTSLCNHYKPEAVDKTPLTCYSCAETRHPRDCNVTTQCHAHQLCVVTQSFNADFQLVYRMGCMDRHQCDAFRHDGLGNRRAFAAKGDCCEHDRCNSLTPDEMTAPAPSTQDCKDIDSNVCQSLRHSGHMDRCQDQEFANVFCPKTCQKCFFCYNCFVHSKIQQQIDLCYYNLTVCQSNHQSCVVDITEENLMITCVNDSFCADADNVSKTCCKQDFCNRLETLTTTTTMKTTPTPTPSTTPTTTPSTTPTTTPTTAARPSTTKGTTFGFMTIPHNQPTTTAFHWATLGTPPPHSTQWVTLPWSGHGQPPPKK